MLKFIQKQTTGDVVVSHPACDNRLANAVIKKAFDWRQQRFLFSIDNHVPNIYCYRSKKIVILLSKTISLTVGNALLRFLRIWNQDRRAYPLSMYEPTASYEPIDK